MALSISGCGCVSDPQRMLFAACDRVSHRAAPYGYVDADLARCADCGRELLYAAGLVPADPCCGPCVAKRYELDRAQRDAFYLQRVATELIRLAVENRGESLYELAPVAFGLTPLEDAPYDAESDASRTETHAVVTLARAELLP